MDKVMCLAGSHDAQYVYNVDVEIRAVSGPRAQAEASIGYNLGD